MSSRQSNSSQRFAIVTGVSEGGIGYFVAEGLAHAGYDVTLATRNESKANKCIDTLKREGIPSERLHFMHLDVSSLTSIKRFVTEYTSTHHKLHLLVNNAGRSKAPPTDDGIPGLFMINFLAPYLLMKMFSKVLIAAQPARIVNVSSAFHRLGFADFKSASKKDGLAGYGNSKLYVQLASIHTQKTLENQGVSVFCVHPGPVLSQLYKQVLPAFLESSLHKFLSNLWLSPKQGATTALTAALDEEKRSAGPIPLYLTPFKPQRFVPILITEITTPKQYLNVTAVEPSALAKDEKLAQELIEFTDSFLASRGA